MKWTIKNIIWSKSSAQIIRSATMDRVTGRVAVWCALVGVVTATRAWWWTWIWFVRQATAQAICNSSRLWSHPRLVVSAAQPYQDKLFTPWLKNLQVKRKLNHLLHSARKGRRTTTTTLRWSSTSPTRSTSWSTKWPKRWTCGRAWTRTRIGTSGS